MGIGKVAYQIERGPRDTLEDAVGALEMRVHTSPELDAVVAVVCDGVGGEEHGEVASMLGVKTITSMAAASLAGLPGRADPASIPADPLRDILVQSLELANAAVVDAAAGSPELRGMSSTVVATLIAAGVLHVAWTGDSRCYLYRGSTIRQLTQDHSAIRALIDAGIVRPEEARLHPLAHTIHRHLGQADGFRTAARSRLLRPNDIILLCTDGLTDVLSDGEIADRLEAYREHDCLFDELPTRLVEHALAAGTTDNVTVLCCEYAPDVEVTSADPNKTLTGAYLDEVAESLQFSN